MGRPLGEDLGLILGFMANFAALFAVFAPVIKRFYQGIVSAALVLVLSFILASGWMMLSEWLYQKRSLRKGDYDFRFLFLFHFAPTAAICASVCFLLLWLALVH
jgi:hypothetical protein